MDGDYFMEDGFTRLQDFHVFSPMVDMDLNGTVDRNWNLDMVASVHEINMERFANKFPYPVSGKGTFAGEIGSGNNLLMFKILLLSRETLYLHSKYHRYRQSQNWGS